jgi:uracil-DNA glycosylase
MLAPACSSSASPPARTAPTAPAASSRATALATSSTARCIARASRRSPSRSARDDGLALRDAYIVTTIRCAPPDNAPAPDEIAHCAPFLDAELALLPHVRVVLALGAIAWRAVLDHHVRAGGSVPRPRPAFAHGAHLDLGERALLGSYHVSQQNTQTGKLTPEMFDAVLDDARRRVDRARTRRV